MENHAMLEKKIEYIPLTALTEHPDNPRKSIGDVSELADSIRRQGIMQNLTVVPDPENDGKYRIVIGHRRFNAARLAGLETLPCVVDTHMDKRAQIATMMSENMQRNDLTIAERVGGVQMMMDLGLDVKDISKDTGLSESSVRRYKKLIGIGSGVSDAEKRGLTISDLEKIADIPYAEIREEAMNSGEISRALYKSRAKKCEEEVMPKMRALLEMFAEETDGANNRGEDWSYCEYFSCMDEEVLAKIRNYKKKPGERYGFIVSSGSITLRKLNKTDAEAERKTAEARERLQKRRKREEELAIQFRFCRRAFVSELHIAKDNEAAAKRFLLWVMTAPRYTTTPQKNGVFAEVYFGEKNAEGLKKSREETAACMTNALRIVREDILRWSEKDLMTAAVIAAYDRVDSSSLLCMLDWNGRMRHADEIECIRTLYDMLCGMGYPKSAEEDAWLNGTHECFSDQDGEDDGK